MRALQEPAREPRSVTASVRLYRALLAAYPPGFRKDYGEPMAQVFRDCALRASSQAGAPGLLALWARTMLDYLLSVVEEHANRGAFMTRSNWIKLSGWGFITGSVLLGLTFVASTRPETYDIHNAANLPIDRLLSGNMPIFSLLALLTICAGMAGLLARFTRQAGRLGQAGLALGIAAGLVGAVGAAGLQVVESEPWWYIFLLGMMLMFIGLAVFGVASLRRKLLGSWSALPLVVGVWIPLVMLGLSIFELITGRWLNLPPALTILVDLLPVAALLILGIQLQNRPSESEPAAAAASS